MAVHEAAEMARGGVLVSDMLKALRNFERPRWEQGWGVTVVAEAENRKLIVTSDGHAKQAMAYPYGTRLTHIPIEEALGAQRRKPDEHFDYLVGKVYGHLTAVRVSPVLGYAKRRRLVLRCVCGKLVTRIIHSLNLSVKKGFKPSCGCMHARWNSKRNRAVTNYRSVPRISPFRV